MLSVITNPLKRLTLSLGLAILVLMLAVGPALSKPKWPTSSKSPFSKSSDSASEKASQNSKSAKNSSSKSSLYQSKKSSNSDNQDPFEKDGQFQDGGTFNGEAIVTELFEAAVMEELRNDF